MSARLKQASFFLRCFFHCIVFGPYPTETGPPPSISVKPSLDYLANLRRMQRFYGIYTHVGKQIGVTPQHVRHTMLGLSVSARVLEALKAEYYRIESSEAGA